MSHFKLAEKEINLFIRSMIAYQDRLKVDHPYSDSYPYNHEVRKEKRYLNQTIGKMENELKIRAMRKFKVTVWGGTNELDRTRKTNWKK